MPENSAATCALFTLAGFLSGSVMFSYLIPKIFKGVDIREKTFDRNPGGANAIRAVGTKIGLLCILLDVLKGFIPVFSAVAFAGIAGFRLVPIVAAPILGHAFSPFLNFRGGKGVASLFGALLGILPLSKIVFLLVFFAFFFKFIAVIYPDSFGFSVSVCATFLASFLLEPMRPVRAAFLIAGLVIVCRSKKNPDPGAPCIRVGHYFLSFENQKVKVRRQ